MGSFRHDANATCSLALTAACMIGAGAAYAWAEGGGDLVVFDWSGYEDPLLHPAYTAKHGAEPTFAFFGDEDEAFEKMRGGLQDRHPRTPVRKAWRNGAMPACCSRSTPTPGLPGWKDLNPGIHGDEEPHHHRRWQGVVHAVRLGQHGTALSHRQCDGRAGAVVRILADPKFKGRVTIGDNVDDAYALASLVIGLKDWTKDDRRAVQGGVRFPASGAQERPSLLDRRRATSTRRSPAMRSTSPWGWGQTLIAMNGQGVPSPMNRDTKEGMSTWVWRLCADEGRAGQARPGL